MTGFGLGSVRVPQGEAEVSFRGGWLKRFRVGLGSAGAAAVVIALFELLQRQPEGFRLLGAWGPWPLVALVALGYAGHFLSRLSDSLQTTFSVVVQTAQQGAEAQSKIAEAVTGLATQGGKQAQEIQRLAIYAAQEFPGVYERLDMQDEVLQKHGVTLEEIAVNVKTLARGKHHGE
jgi:hypothetical protein